MRLRFLAAMGGLVCAGCVSREPVNPSLPVSSGQAAEFLDKVAVHPKRLQRPLVIVGGFLDPGFAELMMTRDFRGYTGDSRVIGVSLGFSFSEESYRRRIIEAVDGAFPSSDPRWTSEVDVIGYSMGGVAARYAAMPVKGRRQLRIARLFTISSPHRGALAAERLDFDLLKVQEQMRPNSAFLMAINRARSERFPIYPYVVLGDEEVGVGNAAPPGRDAWWVSPPTLMSSHNWAFLDSRIRADILFRLSGETPLSTEPAAEPPVAGNGRRG